MQDESIRQAIDAISCPPEHGYSQPMSPSISQDQRPRVLIMGDPMVDEWITVDNFRVSAEQPTALILDETGDRKYQTGGAGNVNLNMKGLGLDVTTLFPTHKSLIKIRYVEKGTDRLLFRFDPSPQRFSSKECPTYNPKLHKEIDAVVIVDYDKGGVEPLAAKFVPRDTPLFIHTKKPAAYLKRVLNRTDTYFFANSKEFNDNHDEYKRFNDFGASILVTNGHLDAFYYTPYCHGPWSSRPPKVSVNSVCGAGDSFMAGFIYATLSNYDAQNALDFAVKCGSTAVVHPRTTVVTHNLIKETLK